MTDVISGKLVDKQSNRARRRMCGAALRKEGILIRDNTS